MKVKIPAGLRKKLKTRLERKIENILPEWSRLRAEGKGDEDRLQKSGAQIFQKATTKDLKRVAYADGSGYFIDHRKTVQEWVKDLGGQFAKITTLFIKTDPVTFERKLSVAYRSDKSWEPMWADVPDDIVFKFADLTETEKGKEK